ncbi:MAG: sensor histidine kinase [Ktedonobacteraceae bacterium]|nr:sensor histidine kinase [Ktedonobacteraceae bacterium]
MKEPKKKWQVIPGTTLRRLRNIPGYFFLIWRWSTWLLAFLWLMKEAPTWNVNGHVMNLLPLAAFLLILTFLQSLLITRYAPILQKFLPRLRARSGISQPKQHRQHAPWWRRTRPRASDEDAHIFTPPNSYWDVFIYGADVVVCSLVTYFSGYFGPPFFGVGSPFYRYGMSAPLAVALTYRYRGGLIAAFSYVLFALLGAFFPPPGIGHITPRFVDFAGLVLDTPLVVILAAYLATLLENYARNKREMQDDGRRQKALRRIGETMVREASDKQLLLQHSAEQIRQGGHFHCLMIALLGTAADKDNDRNALPTIEAHVEADVPNSPLSRRRKQLLEQVIHTGQKLSSFEPLHTEADEGYGIAHLYLPFLKDGHLRIVIGAESRQQTLFESPQEDFLTIAGAQLLVVLENIDLTGQMVQLAAVAERERIAREIHDGVAQLVYMLSLNSETCATQAHRIAEASEEDGELLTPLATRLDQLVTLSKQALWETRNYMFNLKPLMNGSTNLAQMLANQLREFEAISGLSTHVEVEGSEENPKNEVPMTLKEFCTTEKSDEIKQRIRRYEQISPAIFRVVQEALTNAYKHAQATHIQVYLRHLQDGIELEVCDDGQGLKADSYGYNLLNGGEHQRIYSGHGLRGMHERVEELGGTLEVGSRATGGVQVRVWIPLC